jgi:hypothetical protein
MSLSYTFKGTIESPSIKGGLTYFWVPNEIAEALFSKFPGRSICTIHNASVHCGVLKRKEGRYLIQCGKATLKTWKVEQGMNVDITLAKDESTYGYHFAEELEAFIAQDSEAERIWNSLNPGAQRGFLHYINSAKSIDVRIKRVFQIIERAKEIIAQKPKA